MCMNCLDACPHQSLEFRFFRKEAEVAGPNLPRRKVLTGLAIGIAAVPLLRANTALGEEQGRAADPPAGGAG